MLAMREEKSPIMYAYKNAPSMMAHITNRFSCAPFIPRVLSPGY